VGKTYAERLILVLLFAIGSSFANAAENSRSVFISAACDGRISSAVLSSLRDGIRTSYKYRLVRTLDDEGRMGVVLTIDMNCTESKEIAAVAIAYGLARCVSSTDCRQSVDGNSIRSALCDSIAAEACGRALFKVFDNYMNSPIAPRMKLQ
jgi:hypothetical protein